MPGLGASFSSPVGSAHTFLVTPQEPLRTVQITVPAGFDHFTAKAGIPAVERVRRTLLRWIRPP